MCYIEGAQPRKYRVRIDVGLVGRETKGYANAKSNQ